MEKKKSVKETELRKDEALSMVKTKGERIEKHETGKGVLGGAMYQTLDPTAVALSIVNGGYTDDIETDPLGSWTGVPEDRYDIPVQDADDL